MRRVKRKRLLSGRRIRTRRARCRRGNNGDEKVQRFEEWCRDTGIALHPKVAWWAGLGNPCTLCPRILTRAQLHIGHTGCRGDIGVVAQEDIPQGTLLAVIPRRTILYALNSRVRAAMLSDRAFRKQLKTMNSWVPLLLALLAECGDKVS